MTDEKLRSALLECEAIIAKEAAREGITMAIRDVEAETPSRRISHLHWMAKTSFELLEQGKREKVMRWLGFMQGAIWGLKLASIDSLKSMNRPDDEEHDPEKV